MGWTPDRIRVLRLDHAIQYYHTTIQLLCEHDVIFEFAATAVEKSLTRNSTGRISSSRSARKTGRPAHTVQPQSLIYIIYNPTKVS